MDEVVRIIAMDGWICLLLCFLLCVTGGLCDYFVCSLQPTGRVSTTVSDGFVVVTYEIEQARRLA
jgi:hypothetical protein